MNKCEHGQKVAHFCASDNCHYKQPAGCQLCLKKYHNHIGISHFLSEEQVASLIKKFNVDNTVKPKCRLLQESIYTFFNNIKTEITNSIESLCKNIINQIGYPYLYSVNALNTYKRLKNKEYKKLIQKEFKAFCQLAELVVEKDLCREENSIYNTEVKNVMQLVEAVEQNIKGYEDIIRHWQNSFVHDYSPSAKIREIVKNIAMESKKKDTEHKHSHTIEISKISCEQAKLNIISAIESKKLSELSKDSTPMHAANNQRAISPPRQSARGEVSLDKRIVKDQIKHNQPFSQMERLQFGKNHPNHKIQTLKQELNHKEMEINEKKKLLLDMMKSKDDKHDGRKQIKPNAIVELSKKQQKDNSIHSSKSNSSEQNLEIQSNIQQNTKNYAFTKLPLLDENVHWTQEKQEIKKRLIVIPNLTIQKDKNQDKIHQIDSPLYKKKIIEAKSEDKRGKSREVKKDTEKNVVELKENEEKSLALLLKSLTLKAEEAVTYLEAALKHAQNNLSAAEYLSYLYIELNRPKDCLSLCNKITHQLQNFSESQQFPLIINNNKALALNLLGRYSQSIPILQNCLRHQQKDFLYKNLADAYFSASIYDKACQNYQKSVRMNPNNDELHYNLAVCLYMQANYHKAQIQVRKAIGIQSKNDIFLELESHIQQKIKKP